MNLKDYFEQKLLNYDLHLYKYELKLKALDYSKFRPKTITRLKKHYNNKISHYTELIFKTEIDLFKLSN